MLHVKMNCVHKSIRLHTVCTLLSYSCKEIPSGDGAAIVSSG